MIGTPDRSVRIGWYDSGNMVTPPGRLYDWLLISPEGRGSKVAVNLRNADSKAGDVDAHWLVQLARACAASGTSDSVDAWPRR